MVLLISSSIPCAYGGSLETPLQFDVFLGYDSIIPDASWFPVVCEIKNDGATFNGMVEVTSTDANQGQSRRALVELPTGTLKRLVIPVFSSRGYSSWDVRLFDDRGRMRAEQPGLRPRKQLAARTPLIGCLPRTVNGAPVLRPIMASSAELQPASARFQPQIFPDNPLVLEGMDALYLNSEKASELKDNQVNALLGWLNAGGHLIVAVEQIGDIAASKWLKKIFPCDLKELQPVTQHPELQEWVKEWLTAPALVSNRSFRSTPRPPGAPRTKSSASRDRQNTTVLTVTNELPDDFTFEAAQMQVATCTVREGRVVVAAGDTPLIVTAPRGRGQITALLFSPEREPVRSWKNLPTFWSRIIEVPTILYASADFNQAAYAPSSDGIFGAMLDTKQVHKLPVEWLLLLLIVYLVVIGPLDQFWLKRIGKPMLTWITFPCYVVLFSLLIYFIGYKLRAGESEWNELHVVDVLFNAERAELRGRTYASVYSPANQKYNLESQQKFAAARGELLSGYYGSGQSSEKATFWQTGDSFKAEIFVPVWTSQLFVSDWWQSTFVPVNVTLTNKDDGWEVQVENRTDHAISNAQIVIDNRIYALGDVPAKQTKPFPVTRDKGSTLREFVNRYVQNFQGAVQSRQRAFGDTERGRLTDLPNSTIAASLLSQMGMGQGQNYAYMGQFIAPPGLDVSRVVERGNAILFAWAADYSPIKAINQFSPRRLHRDTLFRVGVAVP